MSTSFATSVVEVATSAFTTMREASTDWMTPSRFATMVTPESRATIASMPVPTSGASVRRSGTAWRCMFEPMRARFASSFSRNGTSDAATETSWFGDTSIRSTSSGLARTNSPSLRQETLPPMKAPLLVHRGVRLGDDVLLLLERGVEGDLVGDAALLDLPVRRLDEAVLVDAGVGRERRDEADVRAFRRLDGADAAVVRGVDVAHLEAGALAGEAARPEGREAPLVRDLGERVRLVHELRELRGPEELLDHRGDRLRVDQVVRHERLDLLEAHALLDRALHADEADAVLVLEQLADRADAAVAEVVDVVDVLVRLAVLEVDEEADHLEDVALREDGVVERLLDPELVVELEPADLGEVVPLGVEEQVDEQVRRRLRRRRITRAQAAVDLHDRLLGRGDLVLHERVAERREHVQVVDEEDLELADVPLAELLELGLGDLLVHLEEDLAGRLVDDVLGGDLGVDLLRLDGQRLQLRRLELLDRALGVLPVLLDDDLVRLRIADVARRALALEQVGVRGPSRTSPSPRSGSSRCRSST